jgi:signal transduction histidine kinase
MLQLIYLRLILLTAGTLLPFFWMVVILGHRRQRNFERIFFFLCLGLTFFFGSSLLELNAELYYGAPPHGLLVFTWTVLCLGLWSIPSLLVHLHVEYASIRDPLRRGVAKKVWLAIAWLPAVLLSPRLWFAIHHYDASSFASPSRVLGLAFQTWLVIAAGVAAYWQRRLFAVAPDEEQKSFHKTLAWYFVALGFWFLALIFLQRSLSLRSLMVFSLIAQFLAMAPLGMLIGKVERFNFLQIGRQRNLIYAVFVTFLALLYLSLVRRATLWLEPFLPPEATSALLLFLPVVFFEPLQRFMGSLLRQTAQTEVDRAQRLMGPINEVARLGDLQKLIQFCERWIADQLQLAEVQVSLDNPAFPAPSMARQTVQEKFEIRRSGKLLGTLSVRAHGAMMSGETYAALELIAEQLPAAFDLCRLIEEKLQLERELAERERLALVGQMAASISHNLKNPLGSIKTILQVQMESAELPASMRQETQMVLEEINRLSAKLNQLLQFSRPGVRPHHASEKCEVARVAENVVNVLRHQADTRSIHLELVANSHAEVAASAESVNDIVSNLLLNALEAVAPGGKVLLAISIAQNACVLTFGDDGPGVPAALREKILQPFFTTKTRGSGLGLAIVARRLEEIGGRLEIESPIAHGKGSRFIVSIPRASRVALVDEEAHT